MCRIISVLNHKGGVAKTATAINLGAALRVRGHRVLLIDLDGQANLTDALGLSETVAGKDTVYEAMKGGCVLPVYANGDGMEVVPACLDLSAAETELLHEAGREIILKRLIAPVTVSYDFILIDCPPSLGLLTLNAMTASDGLLIPVQAEYLAMRGMAKLMNVFAKVKERLNPELEIEGVVMTRYDSRRNLNQSVAELITEMFGEKVFKTYIRENVTIAEATSVGRDVISYAPKSTGAQDYMRLGDELLSSISV
ncbi:Sporulation initiation inhibitor protein soj [Bacteroidales bacterium Barb7]|nr:Sporulation initiation inhibitor protein soj [Bacteroidales bacterium Barb7]OAV76288.1 Sporulation initiation inhibitor protein soj [Bacteroidales bacterium Barb7]OAV76332.1 Sporulation initiation inhibitor protein soj [Bacteroidales bacterium Barb7]